MWTTPLLLVAMLLAAVAADEDDGVVEEAASPIDSSIENDIAAIAALRREHRDKPSFNGAPHINDHYMRTGELLQPHRAHAYNSKPNVAELQKSSPPRVAFNRQNFGLRDKVTHLVNLTFNIGGKDRGTVLIGLFGESAPALVANFRRLVEEQDASRPRLVGTRCVRYAPQYIYQCGDLGPVAREDLSHDTQYRSDDGVSNDTWAQYLEFASTLHSRASDGVSHLPIYNSSTGLLEVTQSAEWERVRNLKHAIGSVSMVLRDGAAGSHFFISATPTGYEFDGLHAVIGIVLSGFTTMVQTVLMQQVPINRDFLCPRDGSEVTVSKASIRRFPGKGFTLYFEEKFADAEVEVERALASTQDPTERTDIGARKQHVPHEPHRFNAGRMRGWLLPIPDGVRARIYETPLSEAQIRKQRIQAQRDLLDSYTKIFNQKGRKGLRDFSRSQRRGRRSSR